MDAIDWLKSEKIEAMTSASVGAYILLLCEAWTRPCCSLPSARLVLMKLARWTGTEKEFESVLLCFEPLKGDRSRLINVRLKREWDAAHEKLRLLSEAGKRGAQMKHRISEARRKKPTPSMLSNGTVMLNEFEQFWSCYPRKTGKREARKAWEKAKEKPSIEIICAAIHRAMQSEQWGRESGRFIPNPSTWLNQGRWDDQSPQTAPSTMESFLSRKDTQ